VITTLGFTTRDRPDYLARCAESFIAHCEAHGRRPRLLVMDDAEPGRHASALPIAEQLAAAHPEFIVDYLGEAERHDLVQRLAAEGLDPAMLEFALLDPEGCGYRLGANRNALQLATLGEHVMFIDDDCLAEVARPPQWSDELAVVGHGTTQEYWYFDDHAAALAATTPDPVDLLAAHEAFLGRPCADVIREAPSVGPWAGGFADAMRGSGTVKVTQNGVVGDSCMFSNIGHLLHGTPATRARLAASAESLETALHSREIIRSPACPTLRLGGLLIGPDYACDHTTPMPPYLPVFRASDTSFSNLLVLAHPLHAMADVPYVITHRALPGRAYNARGISEPWRCSASEAIRALLFVQTPVAYYSVANPLGTIGDRLRTFAAAPPAEFAAMVSDVVDGLIERKLHRIGELLDHAADAPPHYREILAQAAATLERSAGDPRRAIPVELAAITGDDAAALAWLQRLAARFGQVLCDWQAVDAAMRGLHAAGAPVARRLGVPATSRSRT
jgi:hypothetical protein